MVQYFLNVCRGSFIELAVHECVGLNKQVLRSHFILRASLFMSCDE